MTSMLKKTVEMGTLYNPSGWGSKFTFKDANGKNFRMPMAGKTGTPQNWSDAWTVGFSPYYTTAIWFGFDKPGNSLGVNLTGSTLAGPVWADYMREIHQGLGYKDFVRPATGIIDATVCAKSGLLKTGACNEGDLTLPFLEGTQPSEYCNIHGNGTGSTATYLNYMRSSTLGLDSNALLDSLTMPSLPAGLLPERPRPVNSPSPNTRAAGRRAPQVVSPGGSPAALNARGNRLLDGDEPEPPPRRPVQGEVPGANAGGDPVLDQRREGEAPAGAAGASPQDEEFSGGSGDTGNELPPYNPLFE
jgi:penicillin-binding protein 1A